MVRMIRTSLLLASVLTQTATNSWAHVGEVPGGIDVLAGRDLGLETTVGLLLPDGDDYRWLCHESVVGSDFFLTPRYARNAEGVLLTALGLLDVGTDLRESVYRSTDGCGWAAPEGLTDRIVVDVAFNPQDADQVGAVTGHLAGTAEFSGNALLVSEDAGATWNASALEGLDRVFRGLHWSADGATIWATSVWFVPPGAWIHRSTDGGETWQEHAHDFVLDGERWTVLDVLLGHPDDAEVAFLRQAGETGDRLYRASGGGAVLEELLYLPDRAEIHDAAWVDGDLFVASTVGVYIVQDGRGAATFWPGGTGDVRGLAHSDQGLHVVYGPDQGHLMATFPASGPQVDFTNVVGPIVCPQGSTAAERCEDLWPGLEATLPRPEEIRGDDDDSAAPPVGSCDCEGGSAAWVLLGVAAVPRRKR